jgi:hypothetical protein
MKLPKEKLMASVKNKNKDTRDLLTIEEQERLEAEKSLVEQDLTETDEMLDLLTSSEALERVSEEDMDIEKELLDTEESLDLIAYPHSLEKLEAEDDDFEEDLADAYMYKTKDSDGHTYDVNQAWDQGLTYTPPTDPPILAGDDPQGAEIAAGFAPSMENSNPDVEDLPERVDNNDWDLLEDVKLALQINSETGNLTNVRVAVINGVVNLSGTVQNDQDIWLVEEIVADLPGVEDVNNNLEVEDLYEGESED